MSVQMKAIEQAIKLLNAASAQYRIKFEEQEWNTFPVEPEGKKKRGPRTNYQPMYLPYIEQMEREGLSSLVIKVPDDVDLRGFRGAMASAMIVKWGKGNVITEIFPEKNEIHVLHV